jgi:hypothetical protein
MLAVAMAMFVGVLCSTPVLQSGFSTVSGLNLTAGESLLIVPQLRHQRILKGTPSVSCGMVA